MNFMGKELEEIVVTLPYEDGTSLDCGVYSYFEVNDKKYFALLPLKGEKELDFSHSYMVLCQDLVQIKMGDFSY